LKRVLIEAVLLIVVVMVLVVQDCSIVLGAELSIVVVAAVLS